MALRALVLAGTAAVAGLITADLVRHPVVLRDAAAPAYLVLLAAILAGYVAAALLATGRSAPLGALFGVLVAGLWVVELWAGNLASAGPLTTVAYRGSILGTLAATLAGGFLGGVRLGRLADGASVGAWSGMFGGLVVCALAVWAGAFSATVQTADPQALAEFQRSHASDLTTYLVGDWLAAGIGHLVIGLVVGSVLGLMGGAVGAAVSPLRPGAVGAEQAGEQAQ